MCILTKFLTNLVQQSSLTFDLFLNALKKYDEEEKKEICFLKKMIQVKEIDSGVCHLVIRKKF